MATKKKETKKKPVKKTSGLQKFADTIAGGGSRGKYSSGSSRVPKGARRAVNVRGDEGYIDPKTQKFVVTKKKKK